MKISDKDVRAFARGSEAKYATLIARELLLRRASEKVLRADLRQIVRDLKLGTYGVALQRAELALARRAGKGRKP